MDSFEPVGDSRAVDSITSQVRKRIELGLLRPGDKLPSERAMTTQFQVSRNTVRGAIRAMETAGIIELKKGATGGAFVREGSSSTVVSSFQHLFALGTILPEHLGEARTIVGTAAARLVCERATKEDLDELQACVTEAVEAAAAGDIPRRSKANFRFHKQLAKASKNPILEVLTDAVISFNRKMAEEIGSPPNDMIIPSRKRLMKYLLARDAEAASLEMQNNLVRLETYYREAVRPKQKPQ